VTNGGLHRAHTIVIAKREAREKRFTKCLNYLELAAVVKVYWGFDNHTESVRR
jgi:hypothetical protein